MSSHSPQKRIGKGSVSGPPEKIGGDVQPNQALYDVVVNVDGQKFFCLKETLAEHAEFFKRMFNADSAKKDQKEIELQTVDARKFELFLNSINNVDKLTDENIRGALTVAVYLEAPKFEAQCLNHFAHRSAIALKGQFSLGNYCKSKNLMIQVCSVIQHASELNDILPLYLESLSSTAKEVALQRSLELHGYRKPKPHPTPEENFEHMMNQIIDQAEVVNRHGLALADQITLLSNDLRFEDINSIKCNGIASDEATNDPQILDLMAVMDQKARDVMDHNYYQAQIQVLKFKHLFTSIENASPDAIRFEKAGILCEIRTILANSPQMIDRNKKNLPGTLDLALGNRPIDNFYKNFIIKYECRPQPPLRLDKTSLWMRKIENITNSRSRTPRRVSNNIPLPDGVRQISAKANFTEIDACIQNIRKEYYGMLPELQAGQQNQMQN